VSARRCTHLPAGPSLDVLLFCTECDAEVIHGYVVSDTLDAQSLVDRLNGRRQMNLHTAGIHPDATARATALLRAQAYEQAVEDVEELCPRDETAEARATHPLALLARAMRAEAKVKVLGDELRDELARTEDLRSKLQLVATGAEDVWRWHGGGEDEPGSMSNSLPVVMRADTLRALLSRAERDRFDMEEAERERDRLVKIRDADAAAHGVCYHWVSSEGRAFCGAKDVTLRTFEQRLATCQDCLALEVCAVPAGTPSSEVWTSPERTDR
jgi:hypothetical protein